MGLTTKQKAFAETVASGACETLSDAYRATYDAGRMSPSAVNKEASRLAAHPQIAPMIESRSRGLEQKKSSALASRAISVQERVLARLEELSLKAGTSDNVKLQATIALGKTVGMFKDKVEHIQPQPHEDPRVIVDRIMARLKNIT